MVAVLASNYRLTAHNRAKPIMSTDILIVDDERDIRSLISMTLEDEGYVTKQAAGAAEARNLLLSEPPKLAILDIWMRDQIWMDWNC